MGSNGLVGEGSNGVVGGSSGVVVVDGMVVVFLTFAFVLIVGAVIVGVWDARVDSGVCEVVMVWFARVLLNLCLRISISCLTFTLRADSDWIVVVVADSDWIVVVVASVIVVFIDAVLVDVVGVVSALSESESGSESVSNILVRLCRMLYSLSIPLLIGVVVFSGDAAAIFFVIVFIGVLCVTCCSGIFTWC